MDLVEAIYAWTKEPPSSERYGLVQQVTRACVGVPADLAEGHSRGTRKDYAHFVSIARGSLMETETYVMIAERLGFATHESTREMLEQITDLGRMRTTLLRRRIEPPIELSDLPTTR